ncbi:MAG TPA: hypothetical protein ENJ56_02970, partial [Anaerolineae bacterium]|nr:hypothetical protein [Anaerolineae bacterium]
MRRIAGLGTIFFVTVGLLLLTNRLTSEAQTVVTTILIEDQVVLPNAKRLGINLGVHDQFGASQLLKNVITNPGFESGEFATLLFSDESGTEQLFRQDNWEVAWNSPRVGQPVGFWDGARYEVLLGEAQGQQGTITQFEHSDNRLTFNVDPDGQGRQFGDEDLIVVRKPIAGYEANLHNRGSGVADPTETRPNSPGTQSLKLTPRPSGGAVFRYFMDSFGRDGDQTANKLL